MGLRSSTIFKYLSSVAKLVSKIAVDTLPSQRLRTVRAESTRHIVDVALKGRLELLEVRVCRDDMCACASHIVEFPVPVPFKCRIRL